MGFIKDHDECCSSTGIDGSLTFGQGKLDNYGYWENPCEDCELAFWRNKGAEIFEDIRKLAEEKESLKLEIKILKEQLTR